jgi:two-component system chemotaxis response regulator CheY
MIISTSCPVLVVDDVGMMTIVLTQALRVLGFDEIDRVCDVESAIKCLRGKRYGLVLSDIHMKPLDGFVLLRYVRSDPNLSSLPFIFVSGDRSDDCVEAARQAGATAYVVKSFGMSETIESIREALNAAPVGFLCVSCRLPTLETAETVLFGLEAAPVH